MTERFKFKLPPRTKGFLNLYSSTHSKPQGALKFVVKNDTMQAKVWGSRLKLIITYYAHARIKLATVYGELDIVDLKPGSVIIK